MAQLLIRFAFAFVAIALVAYVSRWWATRKLVGRPISEVYTSPPLPWVSVVRVRHERAGTLVVELAFEGDWRARELCYNGTETIVVRLPAVMAVDLGRALGIEGSLSAQIAGLPDDEQKIDRPARTLSLVSSITRDLQAEAVNKTQRRVQCGKCGVLWRLDVSPRDACGVCHTKFVEGSADVEV